MPNIIRINKDLHSVKFISKLGFGNRDISIVKNGKGQGFREKYFSVKRKKILKTFKGVI